jgi:hypothetical protein
MNCRILAVTGLLICSAVLSVASAATIDNYLIVGNQINESTVDVSNYELGLVSALPGSAPAVNSPGVAPTVSTTPTYDGNVAVTQTDGTIKLSDVDIYAGTGVDCAGTYADCTDSGSNLSNVDYDDAAGGSGLRSISDGDGINDNVDFTTLNSEIAAVTSFVNGISAGDITGTIATKDGGSGVIEVDTVVNLSSGLNILNFDTTSNAIDVKANLIFQGAADAFALVLVDDAQLFKTSQGNLVIGDQGIGLNNVLIVATGSNQFDISNTTINGVALWDLSSDNFSNLSVDNMSGCTQLVGNDVDIQNVRLSTCGFDVSVIPIPGAVWLFGSGLALLAWIRRKPA